MADCFQMLIAEIHGVPDICEQWARIRVTVAVEDPAGDAANDQSFDDMLVELTREDDHTKKVLEQLKQSVVNSLSDLSGQFYSHVDGRLYHEGKIYISTTLRDVILDRYHDASLTGHFDAEKTQTLIQRKYFWSKLTRDMGEHVVSCSICAMIKSSRHKSYDKLTSLSAPTHK